MLREPEGNFLQPTLGRLVLMLLTAFHTNYLPAYPPEQTPVVSFWV
jgi:hypothetical protein